MRGLLSVGMLQRLADTCPTLLNNTSLFAGTSTGADIISSLVAGFSPAQIYETYRNPTIFDNPSSDPALPAYDINYLIALQEQEWPTVPPNGPTTLRQLPRKVLFTSFYLGESDSNPWRPLLLHNLENSTTADWTMVDAVVASSAMPGMYGAFNNQYVDGAFVHHDPTLAAIAAAVDNGVALTDITAICFGTGFMGGFIEPAIAAPWGAEQWQSYVGPHVKTPSLLINGTISPILNLALNGTSTRLVPDLCKMLLQDRYVYLNPTLDRTIAENDTDPDDVTYMADLAANWPLGEATPVLAGYWDCGVET